MFIKMSQVVFQIYPVEGAIFFILLALSISLLKVHGELFMFLDPLHVADEFTSRRVFCDFGQPLIGAPTFANWFTSRAMLDFTPEPESE
ncbi:hypothetical protein M5689_016711 [Euphorbia peplus]|nr:hypothetical protein M5689_016711 [Euphorbia peplus]